MTDGSRSDGARSSTRATAGDPELIVAARAGDGSAFGVLRRRHEGAALRLATLLTGSGEAAAVVTQRAFDSTRRLLESGGGPDCAFRLQILRAVRTAAPVPIATELDEAVGDDAAAGVPGADVASDPIVGRSFLALPERWGSVLWHTDVEEQTDAEVASLLGMRTAIVTGLAARSREGLVRGYLAGQVHQLDDPGCSQILDRLQLSISSPAVGARDAADADASVREHLDGCDGCRTAARMLTTLTHDPGPALALVVLGEQGMPYLEAAREANGESALVATRVPARPRSMRLVLVAVALIAVTASVPALRAGAGSDGPAAAGFDPSRDGIAVADNPVAGAVSTSDAVAGRSLATTAPAGRTTGRATITTTGANGIPTRVSVSTSTSIGLDGMPTTVAVIPGVAGGPATTVTGSFPTDGFPVLGPWTVSTTGSDTGSDTVPTGPGATPTGSEGPSSTDQYTPPLFSSAAPTGPSAPAGPGRTVPGTPAPWMTVPGTTVPGTTVPGTTIPGTTVSGTNRPGTTTAPGTSGPGTPLPATTTATAPTNTPTPTTDEDPTSTSDDPTTGPTSTTTTSDEPTTNEPTTEPEPRVVVQTPPTLVAFLPLLRTGLTTFSISNDTGVEIGPQTLGVTVPHGISVTAIRVDLTAGECQNTGAETFACEIPALSGDTQWRAVTLTLEAADDAESGQIVVSVTGTQQDGTITVL